jgi:hypothetical protein
VSDQDFRIVRLTNEQMGSLFTKMTYTLQCPVCKKDIILDRLEFEEDHPCDYCKTACYLDSTETPEGPDFCLRPCIYEKTMPLFLVTKDHPEPREINDFKDEDEAILIQLVGSEEWIQLTQFDHVFTAEDKQKEPPHDER